MKNILKKLVDTTFATATEITSLLQNNDINDELFSVADKIRQQNVGDEIYLRGLIEFSNICSQNCFYCGLRCANKNLERYRLSAEEIISTAKQACNLGYKTVVLQSGEDAFFDTDKMCEIISSIKSLGLALTLSIGEKTFEEYKAYKDAGADRYLLRIETTDAELYKKMHPKMSLENRIRCLKDLRKLNYEVGSGIIVGLPSQTLASIAQDLLFLKELDIDMAGIGPFLPNFDTPLANEKGGSFLLAQKTMAIMRLLLPKINIPATTAMETIYPNGRIIALQSGANVVMPNVTGFDCRKKYEIYPGKTQFSEDIYQNRKYIENKITEINRTISTGYGYRRK